MINKGNPQKNIATMALNGCSRNKNTNMNI